jgi:hypothetical protein
MDTSNLLPVFPLLLTLPSLEVLMFPPLTETVVLPLLPVMVDGVLLELDPSPEAVVVVDSVADPLLLDTDLGRMATLSVRGTRGWRLNSLVSKVTVSTR